MSACLDMPLLDEINGEPSLFIDIRNEKKGKKKKEKIEAKK